jgi:hypothetical protein
MNDHEAQISQTIEDLILNGGIEVIGLDSDGEPLYSFTPKLKILMPELYEEHLNSVNKEMMNLWEKGYVNIDFFEKDPLVTLTEKSLIDEEILKLSKEERWNLSELKRLLERKI